jgi:two-component system, NtrC family, sensor kinase
MTATQDDIIAELQRANVDLQDRLDAALARRDSDYNERIEHQAATIDVLMAMSASPEDPQPVFDLISVRARDICGAYGVTVCEFDGSLLHWRAATGISEDPAVREAAKAAFPTPPTPDMAAGRAILNRAIVHLRDHETEPGLRRFSLTVKSSVVVPLMRGGVPIGTLQMGSRERGGFSDTQVELLKTFAEQAVIAIGSAETYRALQTRTTDLQESLQFQTATANVLKVISASPGELKAVFQAMVENATRLCEAKYGNLFIREGDAFRIGAAHSPPSANAELRRRGMTIDLSNNPSIPLARIVETRSVVHIADLTAEQSYMERNPAIVGLVEFAGARTFLSVPMLKNAEVIGAINIYRQEVRPFNDNQIELVQSFASQAVIAIENTRLLNELRQRTADLSKSLEDLRSAQDRLVQTEKLASLGQLTAGIAHEIKNPLNFVNNFSALSTELIEEMKDMLSDVSLDKNKREDLDEITQMLKSNLDKVVQHGKRADSIVKNMLLHSRQGSGEHRPVDINAIVDESLNLAYHGARAENTGFNITMHRSFDPAVGMADGYPQEITRALLNLISNGFYAATKRKSDAGDGFEPTLTATTKNLGDKIEISIRDNGTGIPTDVKEKIFNPFFTTKPAGEGTGLGLSMSHDIIVKQHGGTIDVDTAPGAFTEFRIVLPRAGASLIKSGEQG